MEANPYLRKAREKSPKNIIQRASSRIRGELVLGLKTLWWSRIARTEMSDRELLARIDRPWPTVADLLESLAGRPEEAHLLPLQSPERTAETLQLNYRPYGYDLLRAADGLSRNEIPVFGEIVDLDEPVDWHRDPWTGWRWPLLYRERFDRFLWSGALPADLKPVTELNRHQHFMALGAAYWLSGDPRTVETFCDHILSWVQTNPINVGVNWYSSLEIAIRLIAWVVAFQFFRKSPVFQVRAGDAFLKSLWLQADFLSHHLSKDQAVPNNHLIGETAGLAITGACFPEFADAQTWRESGMAILSEQVAAQTYPDGANKEQAVGYHRFVAEFLLAVVCLGRRGLLPRDERLEEGLERMLDFLAGTSDTAGIGVLWGDSDDGHALSLYWGRPLRDYYPLLAAGAVLFHREDWKGLAPNYPPEAFWSLGSAGLEEWNRLGQRSALRTSLAYRDAGIYILRSGWDQEGDTAWFRCGPFGLGGDHWSAHAHCDLLSVLLCIGGRPLLIDSGTYLYQGFWRNVFRDTGAHNTLVVDGIEQALPRNEFAWEKTPRATCLEWSSTCVAGSLEMAPGIRQIRRLEKQDRTTWQIHDRVEAQGEHRLRWHFHFAPDLCLRWSESDGSLSVQKNGRLLVKVIPPETVQVLLGYCWYSPGYRRKELSPLLTATWEGELDAGSAGFTWKFQTIATKG